MKESDYPCFKSLTLSCLVNVREGARYNQPQTKSTHLRGIQTMQDFMFAALLFTAYFGFVCCLLHNPKASATNSNPVPVVAATNLTVTPVAQPIAPEPTTIEVAAAPQEPSQDEELEADIWEPATAIIEATIVSEETEPAQVTVEEPARVEDAPESQISPTLEQLLEGIDLDKLQLRPARKIASRLNIAQKVGGKDQPLGFLRAQIKKRLNEQPHEVAPVIEEILRAS
jgi:hypothetical protein